METRKRLLAAALTLALLLTCSGAAFAQSRPILGENPEDDTALVCDALMVKSADSDEYMGEVNQEKPYPNFGSSVCWMTALVVLDHYSLSDTVTAVRKYNEGYPDETPMLGIRKGRTYTIRDLMAAMLIGNMPDAALMLRNLTVQKMNEEAGYTETMTSSGHAEETDDTFPFSIDDFITRMNEKAGDLGMRYTHYANATGEFDPLQITCAEDQIDLFETIVSNKLIAKILEQETYTVESEDAGVKTIKNANGFMNRQNTMYDSRVKMISAGNGESGTQCAMLLQNGNMRAYAAFYSGSVIGANGDELILQVLDQYSAMGSIDLIEDINRLAKKATVNYEDKKIGSWVVDGDEFICFTCPNFVFDKDMITLELDKASARMAGDGGMNITASVSYDGALLGNVQLLTKRSAVSAAAQSAAAGGNVIYESQPPKAPESWIEEYKWLIMIGAAAVLALLVYIMGRFIRDRIEY